MKLASLLAIAGGIVGLAAGGDTASQIASGAAIVSGVAGATGNSNIAKIAGVASLGAAAYSAFDGSSSTSGTSSTGSTDVPAAAPSSLNTAISDNAPDSLNAGGPSGTGQSFSDARTSAQDGTDYNGGLPKTAAAPTTTSVAPALGAAPGVSPGVADATNPGSTAQSPGASGGTSLMNMVKSAGGDVGSFIKNNPELVKIGGTALSSAFGPAAEQVSLLKQKQQMQQDELNRQIANTNNVAQLKLPVAPNPYAVVRQPGT